MLEAIGRALAVFVGVLAAVALVAWGQTRWTFLSTPPKRVIAVEGYASISVPPNKVDVSAAVITAAPTTGAALDQNNQIVNAVLNGLKADGVRTEDIRTTGFTITPQHPKTGDYSQNELVTTGYVVKNSIVLTLDANAYSGKTVDRLVRLGANNIESVTFYVEKGEQYQDRVREDATRDARRKAEQQVKTLGGQLGRVLTIGFMQPDIYLAESGYAARALARQVPVVALMPSQQVFSERVTATFEID